MEFPILQEVSRHREMTTIFGGYNHQISCQETQFYDMKNMTSDYYPVLSPRKSRGIVKQFTNPQAILDKEDLWWIDDRVLYKNGGAIKLSGVTLNNESPKTMAKMGAYIVIMPDRVWINTNDKKGEYECGYMENKVVVDMGTPITFSICEETGKIIEYHDASYYKENAPQDGSYMMTVNANGKPSLKVYSKTTSIWMTVASTYVQIHSEGIGRGFDKEDGIKITINKTNIGGLDNIFINQEDDGTKSINTYIVDKDYSNITIPGIISGSIADLTDISLVVERKVPDMSYITECNNRLWGCAKDGHEIYCCKLGDVKNWNLFKGSAIDSWAATIGSDGQFTGAITYLGYPIFFKEDSLIKIAVSATGAHQTKETRCRGVQNGSFASLIVLNEVLYYKSSKSVCGYNGSLPYSISDELGEVSYSNAVGGAIGNKYYISMCDNKGDYSMFVFDTKNGLWCKEDNTRAYAFCRYKDDLYYIDYNDKKMKSVGGTLPYDVAEKTIESKIDWFTESGPIGYSSPDNKYVGNINIRISLEFGTNVDFFIQYDSSGEWEHKFNMSGKGTRTYSIALIPKRCDHFRYRIVGSGACKIHSLTKTIEEGSDG